METFWYVVVALMLAIYVVLDGYDFGVGMLHLLTARREAERKVVLASIGPVWKGNEVWLIASGGLLFFAFPRAYAAGFSGFYLALIIVLWLFMLRGVALGLRHHFDHPLWTGFWDAGFATSSLLLAVVFGAALGNLIRGVPLNPEGYFFTALWTDLSPGDPPGILDWFTILMAITTVALLAQHGAYYLVMKTTGEVARRAQVLARRCRWAVVPLVAATVTVTPGIQPAIPAGFAARPAGLVFPALAVLALAAGFWAHGQRRETAAFVSSSVAITAFLASAAWGLFPNLLIASHDPSRSLTIWNAAASAHGLALGTRWFGVGILLVAAYSFFVHRLFRGKVVEDAGGGR